MKTNNMIKQSRSQKDPLSNMCPGGIYTLDVQYRKTSKTFKNGIHQSNFLIIKNCLKL